MSHYFDVTYAVYDRRYPRSRKDRMCHACLEMIRAGHRYEKVGIVHEQAGETVVRCLRCAEIHAHLATKGGGEMWPDERLNCGEEYRQHWGEDPPPKIAALAFVTQDETQKRPKT